ncbi:flagellar biosynthetic protein FliR [uncultured Thalassospira sp.]|jgi:flagellar biosynthetic protein FliR|uniref:flagellar biosynthetic protein FliR n=1 Tax=uncultured Thalassospira sp. TaxID=404382 RepID=UPI0030DC6438|tara:strand:- start:6185 stop:6952 length:768 start_codon:yes stop_codon:yes gene_type:complete
MSSLQDLLVLNLYVVLMTFARVGAAFAFMPGFGSTMVPTQVRLLLALWISVVISPLTSPLIPVQPADAPTLFVHLAFEITIGLFFGMFGQILMGALQTAGTIIAYSSSMANAFINDPIAGQQSAVTGRLLTQVGLVLLFATGLDHLMIQAMFETYTLFPPGGTLPTGDMSEFISHAINDSFVIAMKISAPFLVVSIVLQAALGLLNKLMPQLPVFFVAMPVQIAVAFFLLLVVLPSMMMVFLDYFENGLENFLAP